MCSFKVKPMQLDTTIRPRKIAFVLVFIVFVLATMSLITEYIVEVLYKDAESLALDFLDLFSVNLEQSIPTWYSTILLLLAVAILAVIAAAKWRGIDSYRWQWIGLTLIFLYLSMDEAVSIHEFASNPLNITFKTSGYLYFGWQIVAVPIVLIFALLYLRFLFHLPAYTRYGFILSGVIYVSGAIFIEGLSANQLFLDNDVFTYRYMVIATVEETSEMLGVVLFIYSLLSYIVALQSHFQFRSSADDKTPIEAEITPVVAVSEDRLVRLFERIQQSPRTMSVLMGLTGINLTLILWVLVREFTTLLLASEFVLLVVIAVYIVVLLISLQFAKRFKHSWLMPLAIFVLLTCVTLSVWIRLIGMQFTGIVLNNTLYLILIAVTGLVTVFHSLFLPLVIHNGQANTNRFLLMQGMGVLLGLLSIHLLQHLAPVATLFLYATILLGILAIAHMPHISWFALVLIVFGWLWFFPALNRWSNTLWFEQVYGLPIETTTRFTAYTPSHKIDVLQIPDGNLYLYLDGQEYFGSEVSRRRNILMGRIPASLMMPESAVVFGASSMQMELMIANYAGHVTTVESSSLLADVSEQYFVTYNFMDRLENRTISIERPQHFLRNSRNPYNLIAVDLPRISSVQTGSLYTTAFFEAVSHNLTEDGVFVVNLTSNFEPNDETSRRIAASLLEVFSEVTVVVSRSSGLSIAYAGEHLPFTRDELQTAIEVAGETEFGIFETDAVRAITGDAQPVHHAVDWLLSR
jgi:spermidine synthase